MSELKAILATPHPKMKNACDGAIEVYPKSEADKAIADLDESHKMEVEQLLMTILELKEKLEAPQLVMRLNKPEALYSDLETMGRLSHEKYVVERRELHHKYKRCLAMAVICFNRAERANCWKEEVKSRKRFEKWLELAEKFKPNKEA